MSGELQTAWISSYHLDLRGTACSASLTAPDLAVQALRAVGCEAFAVGGCQLIEGVIFVSSIAGIIYSPFGKSCPWVAKACSEFR
ncbi:hypothetical protein BJ138DRAFT_1167875 [Hygrophoropsis aurantiaca]|uniref:Uncharacterized protein n=1 Tax=Hygrophoropsis aurantiaca TaxID=72124 RepID=A0ACB7ZR94_9AGAM|nr:hypothetical protein BJ138DRAFT_1167875 [Hygrophoropsis aurantiaca]